MRDRSKRHSSPEHLWSGDWQAESEQARAGNWQGQSEQAGAGGATAEAEAAADSGAAVQSEPAAAPADFGQPPAEPTREATLPHLRLSRRGLRIIVGGLLLAGLIGGFLAGRAALDQDEGRPDRLPAASGGQGGSRPPSGGAVGDVYASASPAVVSIKSGSGEGTGFLIDRDGKIVTNSHVVADSDRVQVRFGADGRQLDAEVLGTDPSSDLAVVQIEPASAPGGVEPLRFADSDDVLVGDVAIAIGNPFGLDRTATEGIVSGVGREIRAPNGFAIDSVIQTDAPINPGNSGGPLLNGSGRVIGVNSQIATAGSPGNVGVGFAVPSNIVRDVIPRLARGDAVERAYLGLESLPVTPAGRTGALVLSVVPGGPAERGGLRPGEIITSIDGTEVRKPADIAAAIADNKPGDEVRVVVERGTGSAVERLKLGTRPERTP
jgi:putative serine protease PepD